jgi:hypothetical protein
MFVENSQAVEKSGDFEAVWTGARFCAGERSEEDFLGCAVLSAETVSLGEIGGIFNRFKLDAQTRRG